MSDWRSQIWMVGLLLLLPFTSVFAQDVDEQFRQAEAFEFNANDSTAANVRLLLDTLGNPVLYTSRLMTDVCSDGLCKPIDINIYWDLLGNFYQYKTEDHHPLTKFDHIKLTQEDHVRLHEILRDTSSILRDYRVEDMIDTTVKVHSGIILDAVTGATNPTFDGSTVEGALYTVYTLWHFINGSVRRKIYEHTESLMSDSLITHMLDSDNRDYANFIFSKWSDAQRKKFADKIIPLIASKDLFTPHFAISQLTDEVLNDPAYQEAVLHYFIKVPAIVQNTLLARLETVKLTTVGISILLNAVPALSVNQLDKFFQIMDRNRSSIRGKALQELRALAEVHGKAYAQPAKMVVDKMK